MNKSIFEELCALDGVSGHEGSVREYILKKYTENLKENSYWANLMQNYAIDGYDGSKDYEKTLNSITTEDLKKFAKSLLKQGNAIEVSMVGVE